MYGPNANNWMQDNHDVWNNSMDLAGIQNGGIIGFKYFGFGGLAQDTKGVKAFEGTKKGDNTNIYVNLTHGKHGAFKIHILLDDPWKGKEIGVITVAENDQRESAIFGTSVPDVEGLTGKHAIYLVAEGPEVQQPQNDRPRFGGPQRPQRPQGLFDLHGIGFMKQGEVFERPVVPTVTITVDGKEVRLPSSPIFCTNANGYTDLTRYQAYAPIKDNSVIRATASDPSVRIEVSPIVAGRATVTCTYQGLNKVYLIN